MAWRRSGSPPARPVDRPFIWADATSVRGWNLRRWRSSKKGQDAANATGLDFRQVIQKGPRRRNRANDDYEKTIYEIKPDQTVVTGKVIKDKDGKYTYSGTFKAGGAYKDAANLTDADKKAIQDDFEQERSDLSDAYPGVLAFVIPPGDNLDFVDNDNDVDNDGVPNGRDTCVVVSDSSQSDSQGNGTGDACRTVVQCDTDRNGTIDIIDISNILGSRGLPASRFTLDPRDVDGDGLITANDARICALRCNKPNCAQ